jgi:hypothetical protein
MEIRMNEQLAIIIYEPPVLVDLGEFIKDTHGGFGWTPDSIINFAAGQ